MENRHSPYIFLFLILAGIATVYGLFRVNYSIAIATPGGYDFLPRWMGARYWIVDGLSPYNLKVSLASQVEIYGHPANTKTGEDPKQFLYPLTSMLFWGLFGLMDYSQARAIWMTFLELGGIGSAILALTVTRKKFSAVKMVLFVLFAVLWLPNLHVVFDGSFIGINLFLICLAFWLIMKKLDFVAGLVLVLTMNDPKFVLPVVAFTLLWSYSHLRKDVIWGFLGGGGIILAISFLFILGWPMEMLIQLLNNPHPVVNTSPVMILANGMPGIRRQIYLILMILLVVYLIIEWYLVWRKEYHWFLWTACMTMVVSVLVIPSSQINHYVTLVPAFILSWQMFEDRWRLVGRWLSFILGLGLSLGLWLLVLTEEMQAQGSSSITLLIPLVSLVGLWWVRWWALNPPKVFVDEFSANHEY